MHAQLVFWSGTRANMGVMFALVVAGVRPVCAGRIAQQRRAAWSAVSAAGLGCVTAVFVLLGMFSRAG